VVVNRGLPYVLFIHVNFVAKLSVVLQRKTVTCRKLGTVFPRVHMCMCIYTYIYRVFHDFRA